MFYHYLDPSQCSPPGRTGRELSEHQVPGVMSYDEFGSGGEYYGPVSGPERGRASLHTTPPCHPPTNLCEHSDSELDKS